MDVWTPDDGPAWGWAEDLARLRETALAILVAMIVCLAVIAAVIGYLAGSRAAECVVAPAPGLTALALTETGTTL